MSTTNTEGAGAQAVNTNADAAPGDDKE